jgi:amino acid transporter
MDDKALQVDTGSANGSSPGVANTIIGSTGAILGALGVTAVAASAPIAGAVLTAGGTLVAAGALYRKLSEEHHGHKPAR